MKTLKGNLVVILIMFASIGFSYQQKAKIVPFDIIVAFKVGNADELSNYFNNSIELIVLDNEDYYSKTQAKNIMSSFFTENLPLSFKIIHEGGKDNGTSFAIGKLSTMGGGKFRVSLLLKKNNNKLFLHQLKIEKYTP